MRQIVARSYLKGIYSEILPFGARKNKANSKPIMMNIRLGALCWQCRFGRFS